jgi:HD superfamily phosphohydrolase
MNRKSVSVVDALYGDVHFDVPVSSLIARPVVQRLRHVRLSNVDSVALPGIANLSRYEHVLGVSYLVRRLGMANRITSDDRTALEAAAVLHDWAISPYGHIVEEAFAYAQKRFDHEDKLLELIDANDSVEVGGVNRQVFLGRETGLEQWAQEIFGPERARPALREITDWIRGRGRFGKLISSEMDLDNLDNVSRIAFHLGLLTDRELPTRVVAGIVDISLRDGTPIFRREAITDIAAWLELRSVVYDKLMLAEPDFAIKLMVLYAAVSAINNDEIGIRDWNLTDREFVDRLLASRSKECRETAVRWLAGEYWETSPLCWMSGNRPDYADLLDFSTSLSRELGRDCFAYGIKDKRKRQVTITISDGEALSMGSASGQWLFGMGSSTRRPITTREHRIALDLLQQKFACTLLGTASPSNDSVDSEQMCLL